MEPPDYSRAVLSTVPSRRRWVFPVVDGTSARYFVSIRTAYYARNDLCVGSVEKLDSIFDR